MSCHPGGDYWEWRTTPQKIPMILLMGSEIRPTRQLRLVAFPHFLAKFYTSKRWFSRRIAEASTVPTSASLEVGPVDDLSKASITELVPKGAIPYSKRPGFEVPGVLVDVVGMFSMERDLGMLGWIGKALWWVFQMQIRGKRVFFQFSRFQRLKKFRAFQPFGYCNQLSFLGLEGPASSQRANGVSHPPRMHSWAHFSPKFPATALKI